MAVNSFTSKGNEFWCTQCGKACTVDKYGFIHGNDKFDNLHSWNVWQEEFMDEIYENNMPFVSQNVVLNIVNENGTKRQKCDFILDKDGVHLGEIYIPCDKVSSPNLVFTDVVEFFEGKTKYRIKINPKKHTSITLIERLLKKMITISTDTKDE